MVSYLACVIIRRKFVYVSVLMSVAFTFNSSKRDIVCGVCSREITTGVFVLMGC